MNKIKAAMIVILLVLSTWVEGEVRQGFHDDFSHGISADRWFFLRKQWGQGNHGVVPELIKLEKDIVNGTEKNVVVLYGNGDQYDGSVKGIQKVRGSNPYIPSKAGTRVGSVLMTKDYFASGSYEVTMKIENDPIPSGMCMSIWTFHYEEHYASKGDKDGSQINPDDPLYQPRFREGNPEDGWYSTVNSEIDTPEVGRDGDFTVGWYNTYESEVDEGAKYQIIEFPKSVLDGEYHKWRFEWETELVPTDLTDADVMPFNNHNYHYVIRLDSPYQGNAVVKKQDGIWYAYSGKSVTFYLDDEQIGQATEHVSPVSARIIIGVWFPFWAGKAPWKQAAIKISEVNFKPFNSEGDVYYQPESMPNDGLFSPAK